MAEKKDPGLADVISDWWSKSPQAPTPYTINGVPVANQPVDSRTFNRSAPAPYLSGREAFVNVIKNTRPLDFTRDLIKGVYGAGKAVVTDPVGTFKGAAKLGKMIAGIYAAEEAERTGKWSDPEGMSPSQIAKWRQEATENYGKLASHYSYVDKNGERQYDSAALMRNLTQHPMETLSAITPVGELAGAKLASSAFTPLSVAGKAIEGVSKAGNIATNIAPYAIAKGVKAASPVVSAGLKAAGVKPTIFTRSGEYSPKMQQAFADAGVDPALFNSPEMRQIVQGVVNEKGISPAAIKQAALTSQGIDATRSMTTGQAPINAAAEASARTQALDRISQAAQPPLTAADLSGAMHSFDYTRNQWVDAAGTPVTAPGKLQYLDLISNRQSLPRDLDAAARTEAARGIVEAPAETPNRLVPTIWDDIKRYVPSVGAGNIAGYSMGAATGLPGMGLIGGAVGGATTHAARVALDRMAAKRVAQAEFAGAPRAPLFQAPDVRNPATVAGGVATAAQTDYQTPVATAAPAAPSPAPMDFDPSKIKLPEINARDVTMPSSQLAPEKYDLSGFGPSQGELKPEVYDLSQFDPPQRMHGGRTAYKSGGKVNGIEPLVLALMNKAKMAKKTSNKATEPLLNERDDAIANALAVAQKAI
jgi:hypothetical protein